MENKIHLLQKLSKLKRKEKYMFVQSCSDEDIHIICSCFYSLLKGAIPLDRYKKYRIKKILDPIKEETLELANPKTNINKKRNILKRPQVGKGIISGLGTLIGIILPAIISAVKK